MGPILALATFVFLAWMERHRTLRRQVEPKRIREARNPAVARIGAAALRLAGRPLMRPLLTCGMG